MALRSGEVEVIGNPGRVVSLEWNSADRSSISGDWNVYPSDRPCALCVQDPRFNP